MNLILGAGLAGLSASYHLGHSKCLVLEAKRHAFGHIHSIEREGFVWDEGPHVSFTSSEYVRELFWQSVEGSLLDYPVKTVNYYKGHWIDHPAQSNFYQIPEPLRSRCLESFRATRAGPPPSNPTYAEWIEYAFGPVFAREFPAAYTRKYWTVEASELGVNWIGQRVFFPKISDVELGALGPLPTQTHYIKTVRYPLRGGYMAFARKLAAGANLRLGCKVVRVSLAQKKVWCEDGSAYDFERLVVTIPLPEFLSLCVDVDAATREAASQLSCSSLDLVEVTATHPSRRPENWMYVYDEDLLSTRINCTDLLSPHNAPAGTTGIQVEVYSSRHRALAESSGSLGRRVTAELRTLGLLDPSAEARTHVRHVPWANVIFHHQTKPALERIWSALEAHGLRRSPGDAEPIPDHEASRVEAGSLCFAGRFGQWNYAWSDDCVLRGRVLAHAST